MPGMEPLWHPGALPRSTSCAVTVTRLPATGLLLLEVTMYFAAAPNIVVKAVLVPVRLAVSVPTTV